MIVATTRAALLRGTTENALGDEVDDLAAVTVGARTFDDFPASIIEKSRREFDEASNAWRTVRYLSGRIPGDVPAAAGDRIRDNRDGSLYIVSECERMARGLSGRSSVTLTLKRTAAS